MSDVSPQRIRVGFDDQVFQAQERGGVSKSYVELVQRLPAFGIDPVILSTGTRNFHLAESGLVPRLPARSWLRERAEWVSWRLMGHPRTLPAPLPQLDLVHHTFTHPSYLGIWRGPRVVSVYDMTPELFPESFRLGNPHFAKRRFCEAADAIIAVSANTAQDLFRLYSPELEGKTRVIGHGVADAFFLPGQELTGLPDRYLLYVGMRGGYKDFEVALRGFQRLANDAPDLDFVVAGGGSFSVAETAMIAATGLSPRVHHVRPSDAQMPELYRHAEVFVFPSRYEGFGLPTLEALAAGTPTVLADASCSREVGGDVASYFAPGSDSDLAAAVARARGHSDRQRGVAHARAFSWDRVAAQTAALYRDVLGS